MDGMRCLFGQVFTLKNTIGNSDCFRSRKADDTDGAGPVWSCEGYYCICLIFVHVHSSSNMAGKPTTMNCCKSRYLTAIFLSSKPMSFCHDLSPMDYGLKFLP